MSETEKRFCDSGKSGHIHLVRDGRLLAGGVHRGRWASAQARPVFVLGVLRRGWSEHVASLWEAILDPN